MTSDVNQTLSGAIVKRPARERRVAFIERVATLRCEGCSWRCVADILAAEGFGERTPEALKHYWRYHAAPELRRAVSRKNRDAGGPAWRKHGRKAGCSDGQMRIVVALQSRGVGAIAAALAAAGEAPLPEARIAALLGSPDLAPSDPLTSLLLDLAAQRRGYAEIASRLAEAGFPRFTANSISIRLRRLGQGRPRNASRRYDRGDAVDALLRACCNDGLDSDATLARLDGAGHRGWNRKRLEAAMRRIRVMMSNRNNLAGRRTELSRIHELRQAGLIWSEVAAQIEAEGMPRYRPESIAVRYGRHKAAFAGGNEPLPRWDHREVLAATRLAADLGDHAAIAGELARRGFPSRPTVAVRWILASLSRTRCGRRPARGNAAEQSAWSLDELQYLRAHYGRATTEEIASALGRRSTEVYRVATALALKARRRGRRRKEEIARIAATKPAAVQPAASRRAADARQGILL